MDIHIELTPFTLKRYRLRALAVPPEQYVTARIIEGTGLALPAGVRVHVYAVGRYLLIGAESIQLNLDIVKLARSILESKA